MNIYQRGCWLLGVGLIACTSMNVGCASRHANMWKTVHEGVAVVRPTTGSTCHGVVRFQDTGEGLRIVADIEGLDPNSTHAFHVHQYGDATAPDGTSAGGHYNPEGMPHGRPTDVKRHAGDLGNLVADAAGNAHYEIVDNDLTVAGLINPVIGRAVIIHRDKDKFVQPTGAAGPRIGIGIIGIANPKKQ